MAVVEKNPNGKDLTQLVKREVEWVLGSWQLGHSWADSALYVCTLGMAHKGQARARLAGRNNLGLHV